MAIILLNVLILMIASLIMLYIVSTEKKIIFFLLIIYLFISQLLIIEPGGMIGGVFFTSIQTYNIFGWTLSAILSVLIILFCSFKVACKYVKNERINKKDCVLLFTILCILFIGFLGVSTIAEKINYSMKIMLPFIVFFYIKNFITIKDFNKVNYLIIIINIILLGQLLVCKLMTGRFAASSMYNYILSEEYFGYYNSPHPFAAVLGLLCFWYIFCISIKKNKNSFNIIAILLNILVIVLSGVRTYLLAILVSFIFLFLLTLISKRNRKLKRVFLWIVPIIIVFSPLIIDFLLNSRLGMVFSSGADVSSGRMYRWISDWSYISSSGNFISLLFGKGFYYIYHVNYIIEGVEINSLNYIIDLVADIGLVGTFLFNYILISIFKDLLNKKYKYIVLSIGGYLLIGLFSNNLLPYVTVMPMAIIILYTIKIYSVYEMK